MSEADDRLHLEEMLVFAGRVVEHTAEADREVFLASALHRDALSMWLLALGEGARAALKRAQGSSARRALA